MWKVGTWGGSPRSLRSPGFCRAASGIWTLLGRALRQVPSPAPKGHRIMEITHSEPWELDPAYIQPSGTQAIMIVSLVHTVGSALCVDPILVVV